MHPRGRRRRGHPAVLLLRLAVLLVVATTGALLFWSVVPTSVGWSSQVVLSGSMAPRVHPGDVVVSQPVEAAQVRLGQVVVVADPAHPGHLLLHRLVGRTPQGLLITKGDANRRADSTGVPASSVRGLARLKIPYVGLPALWWQQGRHALVAGLMLLVVTIAPLARVRLRPSAPATSHHRSRGADIAGAGPGVAGGSEGGRHGPPQHRPGHRRPGGGPRLGGGDRRRAHRGGTGTHRAPARPGGRTGVGRPHR